MPAVARQPGLLSDATCGFARRPRPAGCAPAPQSIQQATQQAGGERQRELLAQLEAHKAKADELRQRREELEAQHEAAQQTVQEETEKQKGLDASAQQLGNRWGAFAVGSGAWWGRGLAVALEGLQDGASPWSRRSMMTWWVVMGLGLGRAAFRASS